MVPRFAPTRPPVHWTGVLSATRHGAVCPQQLPDTANTTRALRTMSRRRLSYLRSVKRSLGQQAEDCLNLNIYSPAASPARSRYRRLPVIVFIHGESYEATFNYQIENEKKTEMYLKY